MKAIKLAILLVLFTSLSFAQVIESEAGSESDRKSVV